MALTRDFKQTMVERAERDPAFAKALLDALSQFQFLAVEWGDIADYLKTEEGIARCMEAAMEEGGDDANFIAHALGDIARAHNMSQLARDTGLTREGLYKSLSGDGNPSFATVLKVANTLGLRLHFEPAKKKRAARSG